MKGRRGAARGRGPAGRGKQREKSGEATKTAGNAQDRNKCSICLDYVQRPIALPCNHVFCAGCLREFVRHQATERTTTRRGCKSICPNCRQAHVVHPDTLIYQYTDLERVEARFQGSVKHFPGVIVHDNKDDTFHVIFDDGDSDPAVPRRNLRKLGVKNKRPKAITS